MHKKTRKSFTAERERERALSADFRCRLDTVSIELRHALTRRADIHWNLEIKPFKSEKIKRKSEKKKKIKPEFRKSFQ